MQIENPKNILAIDHGNHSIKTPDITFPCGLESYVTVPQLAEQYLSYKDRYYILTGEVPKYMPDKTQTEDLFIYTLFAIDMEAKKGNLNLDKPINLAIGLPPVHMTNYKRKYLNYFSSRKDARLVMNGATGHDIHLGIIRVYPQGISAMIAAQAEGIMKQDKMPEYTSFPRFIIVDIGGGTVDIAYIKDGKPVVPLCFTEEIGVGKMEEALIRRIFSECNIRMHTGILEDIMRGKPNIYQNPKTEESKAVSKQIMGIIRRGKKDCAETIVNTVNNRIDEAQTIPWIFEGAGTELIRPELESAKNIAMSYEFCTDQNLNAKGYFFIMDKEIKAK